MARVKMSDAEREAKRKARIAFSFSDAAYKHYDTSNGYGSVDEWLAAADAMAQARGFLATSKPKATGRSADLLELGLMEMPSDIAALKKAFRNAMFVAHPDHGGSNEAARNCLDAYGRLLKHF